MKPAEHIAVLGAGILGVTTAWFLAERGYRITIIEREAETARAGSFANGGQLSYSHAEPWANPHTLRHLPQWLLRRDAPLGIGWLPSRRKLRWALSFLMECRESRVRENTRHLLALGLYGRSCMQHLLEYSGMEYSRGRTGILHLYPDYAAYEAAVRQVEYQANLFPDADFQVLSRRSLLEREPALAEMRHPVAGAIHMMADEFGDARDFARRLGDRLAGEGRVDFRFDTPALSLKRDGHRIRAVETAAGEIEADAFVVTLGAYTPKLLRPMGIELPLYPLKGYSITMPWRAEMPALRHSLTDAGRKLVITPLDGRLRVAGTAELVGYDSSLQMDRIRQITGWARDWFPDRLEEQGMSAWACLRPATPNGRPLIGATRFPNLFLNTGHGTLGWTLAAGSASLVSQIISGEAADLDMAAYHPPI